MEISARSAGGGSRRLVAISAAAVLIAGGIGFVLLGGGAKHSAAQPSASDVTPTAAEASPAKAETNEPAPQRVQQVTITLDTKPSGADVYRESDGVRVGKTPYRYTLDPIEGGELIFLVKRDGYEPTKVTFPANQTGAQLVKLEKKVVEAEPSREAVEPEPEPEPRETVLTSEPREKTNETRKPAKPKEVKKPKVIKVDDSTANPFDE